MAKVLVGTCVKRVEEGATDIAGQSVSINNKTGLPIDTYTDESNTVFFKFHMSEMYPEFLMVYRDTNAGPDTRSSRLSLEYCKLSYRSGRRLNPQDEKKVEVENDPNKIERVGVSFETEIENKKPKIETQGEVTPKLPKRRLFSLMKPKKNMALRDTNQDIELTENKIEE